MVGAKRCDLFRHRCFSPRSDSSRNRFAKRRPTRLTVRLQIVDESGRSKPAAAPKLTATTLTYLLAQCRGSALRNLDVLDARATDAHRADDLAFRKHRKATGDRD